MVVGRVQMATVGFMSRAQDRDDLGDLYERHAPQAHRLAFLMIGDQEEASDVVQDAFVRLVVRFRDLRHPEAFEWYLRRTVINLCRDRQRRTRSERARAQRLESESQRAVHLSSTTDSGLIDLLRELPHRQKAAIVLRYFEDLSVEDVAKLMGCSNSAIKSLVNRGMRTLRDGMSRGEPWTT